MMKNGLEKPRVIKRELLREEDYLQSLLEQAHEKGLLAESELERLQYECLALLAYKTERFNAGDSSSIRVEKAQSIMESIFFTIGLWLKTFPNPDDAVIFLQREPIEEIYNKGRKRIDTMLKATKTLHAKLLLELIETPNVFYAATLKDAILGFFKLYAPDSTAQEIHITADYPLFNPMPRLAGIEFIKAYVAAAYYENRFCGRFPAETIHRIMNERVPAYKGLGCGELLTNIYGHVLKAALTDIMTKTGTPIQQAAEELIRLMRCSAGLARYISDSVALVVRQE
jgi:hypothetical protein